MMLMPERSNVQLAKTPPVVYLASDLDTTRVNLPQNPVPCLILLLPLPKLPPPPTLAAGPAVRSGMLRNHMSTNWMRYE